MDLNIGDALADGSIIVQDKDRLCYQVLSTSKGASGVRTISKSLLDEWIAAVNANPQKTSQEIRTDLCGKSATDKFEYGYNATLQKLAEMSLGRVPVTHQQTAGKYILAAKAATDSKVFQRITYGAPGTGKSWGIEEIVKQSPDNVVRTTFHPDSDYSTFVGAYKPTMKPVNRTYVNEGEEKEVVDADGKVVKEEKIAYAFVAQAFTEAYVKAWAAWAKAGGAGECDPDQPKEPTGIDKGMVDAVVALIAEKGAGCQVRTDEIVDKFHDVTQNAYAENSAIPSDYCYNRFNVGMSLDKPKLFEYVSRGTFKCLGQNSSFNGPIMARPAGSKEDKTVGQCTDGKRVLNASLEPIYLVIEEINRGNCAQVFGDIFQLLDREGGYSKYPIRADADLRNHLAKAFAGLDFGEKYAKVQTGELLVLPNNLCIWATMNTSDQSLFPMDSAFKRRWDWEYAPIKDEGKGWYVKVGADKYKWWSFLEKINPIVNAETESADKKMGYFFVKLPEGQKEISVETFVNKVAFYLWNDVFKDCEIREDALKLLDANGKPGEPIKFTDFFKPHSSSVEEKVVKDLMDALKVEKESSGSDGQAAD